MKKLLILLILVSISYANFEISHSQSDEDGDLYRSSTFLGMIKDETSKINIEARRNITPKNEDYKFKVNASKQNDEVEFTARTNIRKTKTYNRYNFGLGADLYYDQEFSPFVLFEYRSNGNYTREGIGIAWTLFFDKNKWPGEQKISYAYIEEKGSLVHSYRYKTTYKGDLFSYKFVYFNISGKETVLLKTVIPVFDIIKIKALYDYDEIAEYQMSAAYKITDRLSIKFVYSVIDGYKNEGIAFDIKL